MNNFDIATRNMAALQPWDSIYAARAKLQQCINPRLHFGAEQMLCQLLMATP
jgi:hypothetical protein